MIVQCLSKKEQIWKRSSAYRLERPHSDNELETPLSNYDFDLQMCGSMNSYQGHVISEGFAPLTGREEMHPALCNKKALLCRAPASYDEALITHPELNR